MPRHKKAPDLIKSGKYTLEELVAIHEHDPAEALFKLLTKDAPFPEDAPDVAASLLDSHEIYLNEKGVKRLRLKTRLRIEINRELMQYFNPKLRGQEIRGTVDHNFNITIKTFEPPKSLPEPSSQSVIDVAVEKVG